jgi:hypothetical protein
MAWQFSGYDPIEPFKGPWRVGGAIEKLGRDIDSTAPYRKRTYDGTKGDEAHQQRNSDHNPHIMLGDMGIVTAIDITHDPSGGADMGRLTEALRLAQDPRIRYVIFNRKMYASYWRPHRRAWVWGSYYGSSPHTGHAHFSFLGTQSAYDDDITPYPLQADEEDEAMRRGDNSQDVARLQDALVDTGYASWSKPSDGVYGGGTAAAVAAAQENIGFVVDGDYASAAFMSSIFARQLTALHDHDARYASLDHGSHGPIAPEPHDHLIKFPAYTMRTEDA